MQIPIDTNIRAEAMWRIISQRVDFRGKRVVDLGCGTGDFLWRAQVAGAEKVIGIDVKIKIDFTKHSNITIICDDINELVKTSTAYDEEKNKILEVYNRHSIAMCFSVLPYLDDIPATLKWMAKNFKLCLIEAQYDPEPYNVGVLSDTGMGQLLLANGFEDIEPLGFTIVKDRFDDYGNPTKRTIWMCK